MRQKFFATFVDKKFRVTVLVTDLCTGAFRKISSCPIGDTRKAKAAARNEGVRLYATPGDCCESAAGVFLTSAVGVDFCKLDSVSQQELLAAMIEYATDERVIDFGRDGTLPEFINLFRPWC